MYASTRSGHAGEEGGPPLPSSPEAGDMMSLALGKGRTRFAVELLDLAPTVLRTFELFKAPLPLVRMLRQCLCGPMTRPRRASLGNQPRPSGEGDAFSRPPQLSRFGPQRNAAPFVRQVKRPTPSSGAVRRSRNLAGQASRRSLCCHGD